MNKKYIHGKPQIETTVFHRLYKTEDHNLSTHPIRSHPLSNLMSVAVEEQSWQNVVNVNECKGVGENDD